MTLFALGLIVGLLIGILFLAIDIRHGSPLSPLDRGMTKIVQRKPKSAIFEPKSDLQKALEQASNDGAELNLTELGL